MCIEHVFTNKKEKGVEMSDLKLLNSDYNYIAVHLWDLKHSNEVNTIDLRNINELWHSQLDWVFQLKAD